MRFNARFFTSHSAVTADNLTGIHNAIVKCLFVQIGVECTRDFRCPYKEKSIGFNPVLYLRCLLNSPKVSYKVSMNKQRNRHIKTKSSHFLLLRHSLPAPLRVGVAKEATQNQYNSGVGIVTVKIQVFLTPFIFTICIWDTFSKWYEEKIQDASRRGVLSSTPL
jgi:hypothetical protein